MARQKLKLSEEELKRIETMSGLGLHTEQMAAIIGMSKATFDRRMSDTPGAIEALEKGRSIASLNVTQTAYQLAVSGHQPAMTMFWLKCRQRWKETTSHEISGPDGEPVETRNVSTLSDEQLNAKIAALFNDKQGSKS